MPFESNCKHAFSLNQRLNLLFLNMFNIKYMHIECIKMFCELNSGLNMNTYVTPNT